MAKRGTSWTGYLTLNAIYRGTNCISLDCYSYTIWIRILGGPHEAPRNTDTLHRTITHNQGQTVSGRPTEGLWAAMMIIKLLAPDTAHLLHLVIVTYYTGMQSCRIEVWLKYRHATHPPSLPQVKGSVPQFITSPLVSPHLSFSRVTAVLRRLSRCRERP